MAKLWLTPTPAVVYGEQQKDPNISERMAERYVRTGGEGNLLEQVASVIHREDGFSPPDTHASRSPMLDDAPARMTPGTSGRGLEVSLPASARTARIGSCLRTLLGTSAWGSTVCSMTWRMKATPAGRPLFRLQVSVPSTAATGSGSSPTTQPHPSVATKDGLWTTPTTEVSEKKVPYAKGGKSLAYQVSETQRHLWPTPVADDTHRSVEAHLAMKRDMKGGPRNTITSLSVAVKDATSEEPVMLWPTPNAARAAMKADGQGAGGQKLNPAFVERLMGYPAGWTDLSDSSDGGSSTGSR